MTQWQPQQYDPNWHSRRIQGQPQPQYGQPQYPPQQQPREYQRKGYEPQRQPPSRRGRGSGYGPWIALGAVVLAVAAAGAVYELHGRTPTAAAGGTAQATAQPETEAGVRSAATQFYALYTAGQWAPAWQMLTPAAQRAVPESTYAAVHQGCPSASAGVSRVIKSVTMAGSAAVVTETLSGAGGALGSVTDAWSYAGGRWGIALSQSAMAGYSHGSAHADVAAMKAAGDCAS